METHFMKIHEVEQGGQEWAMLRAGRPTASEFKRMITNTIGEDGKYALSKSLPKYAAKLAAELFAGKPMEGFDGNAWMDRGREMEEEAVEWYAFTRGLEPVKVGFVTDDAMTVGCSPDRLVDPDGGLEIKCLRAENHVELTQYYAKHGRAEPKYTQQVQACLWISGRAWWDQLYYSPELPPLVIRQTPDLVMHASFAEAVAAVIRERDAQLATMKQTAA